MSGISEHRLRRLEDDFEAAVARLDAAEARLDNMNSAIMEIEDGLTMPADFESQVGVFEDPGVTPSDVGSVQQFTGDEPNSEEVLNSGTSVPQEEVPTEEPTDHMSTVVGTHNSTPKANQPGVEESDLAAVVSGMEGGA